MLTDDPNVPDVATGRLKWTRRLRCASPVLGSSGLVHRRGGVRLGHPECIDRSALTVLAPRPTHLSNAGPLSKTRPTGRAQRQVYSRCGGRLCALTASYSTYPACELELESHPSYGSQRCSRPTARLIGRYVIFLLQAGSFPFIVCTGIPDVS